MGAQFFYIMKEVLRYEAKATLLSIDNYVLWSK